MKKLRLLIMSVIFLTLGIFVGSYFKDFSIVQAAGDFWSSLGNNVYNTNSGYVGIGTASPVKNLHLNSGTTNTGMRLESTDPDSVFEVVDSNASQTMPPYYGGRGNNQIIGRFTNIWLFIDGDYGNVGIGTTAPGAKLDVNGDVKVGGVIRGDSNGNVIVKLGN